MAKSSVLQDGAGGSEGEGWTEEEEGTGYAKLTSFSLPSTPQRCDNYYSVIEVGLRG